MQDSIQLSANQERSKQGEKYKKVKILGQGSMGRAYLVESTQDSGLFVMKRINIGHLNPKQKQNALREAQLHSLFTHPNIIQLKQVYQTTGEKICIIMQYAQGGDLQEFIQSQNGKLLSQSTVISMFIQLCLGIQQIHSKRIIHRDLKTANIFLNLNKQLKIGDFGISKSLDQTQMAATAMVGTPYYLSPQMVQGKPYSTKSDIWALGVILYQLCSLRLPFQANSLPVLALKILKGSFPPIPNQFSKDMKSLILQMLQVDQKKRPSIDSILLKPFVYKFLSKEEQTRQTGKQQEKMKLIKQKQKKIQEKKQKKITEQIELKQKSKKQNKDKREQLRKQMRDDLRKKRGGKQKEYQSEKPISSNSLVVPQVKLQTLKSPAKSPQKIVSQTPKIEVSTKATKKQEPIKPWKVKKTGQKKQIPVLIYAPQLKPVQVQKEEQSYNSNIKVQIIENKKLESKSTQFGKVEGKQQGRKSLTLVEPVLNYHYSDNNSKHEIEQMLQRQSESEFQEQQQVSDGQYQLLMDNVRNVNQLTKQLPNPTRSVCLYEQSYDFDNSITKKAEPIPQQVNNLQQLLKSESLEELRLLLEEKLGQQKFMAAYFVVKGHLDTYYHKLDENVSEQQKQRLRKQFVFNKLEIRSKLSILNEQQFQGNIQLLYTLILYEDLEMQKNNRDESDFRESKYSRLV